MSFCCFTLVGESVFILVVSLVLPYLGGSLLEGPSLYWWPLQTGNKDQLCPWSLTLQRRGEVLLLTLKSDISSRTRHCRETDLCAWLIVTEPLVNSHGSLLLETQLGRGYYWALRMGVLGSLLCCAIESYKSTKRTKRIAHTYTHSLNVHQFWI